MNFEDIKIILDCPFHVISNDHASKATPIYEIWIIYLHFEEYNLNTISKFGC